MKKLFIILSVTSFLLLLNFDNYTVTTSSKKTPPTTHAISTIVESRQIIPQEKTEIEKKEQPLQKNDSNKVSTSSSQQKEDPKNQKENNSNFNSQTSTSNENTLSDPKPSTTAIQQTPTNTSSSSSNSTSSKSSNSNGISSEAGMVWIPKSGQKYHKKSTCSGMKEPSQVTKEQAESWGYTPCKKCYK